MPLDRRRKRESTPPSIPEGKRPSNPRTVAKARLTTKPPRSPSRPAHGKKKGSKGAPGGPLPASVTMSVARIVRGSQEPDRTEARWGVEYRFVVRDAEGKPIVPGSFTIRHHLLHLASSGAFSATEKGARIHAVALDSGGGGADFVGIPWRDQVRSGSGQGSGSRSPSLSAAQEELPMPDGEERLLEYFSFELSGITYAIPQSGFVVERAQRAGRLEILRKPHATGSIHGAVVPGLVENGGGDMYVLPLPR